MAINGIGGGGFRPTAPPPGPSGPDKTGKKFEISRPATSASTAVSQAGAPGLEKLRAGELTMDQYLEERVDTAVSHISSRLSPEQLGAVRQQLRDQLSTDPVLVNLVKQSTGQSPTPDGAVSG